MRKYSHSLLTIGWHGYNKDHVPAVWVAENGELTCRPDKRTEMEVTDLVTDNEYENYDFTFEWKINEGGNSGVFINVAEKKALIATWMSGPEYQLLEKSHVDFDQPTKKPGVLYGFPVLNLNVSAKPAGQWNQSRIKQENGKTEFYLNGVLTASYDFNSLAWKDEIKETHFKDHPEFGKNTKGHIALQDWQKPVAFRNMKIKVL